MVKTNKLRHFIQISMTVFLLYIGWRFYQFVLNVQSGGQLPYVSRPAVVEGFLPISALLGFKQWLLTGIETFYMLAPQIDMLGHP